MKVLRGCKTAYLSACLALLVFFMVTLAPLWVQTGSEIVICSALGTKVITVDETGKALPSVPKLKKQCSVCLVAASVFLSVMEGRDASLSGFYVARYFFQNWADLVLWKRRYDLYAPRAPPVFS